MSSTKRSGVRLQHASDYYVTPQEEIAKFLAEIVQVEPTYLRGVILDPCAGGDASATSTMPYPEALFEAGAGEIITIDIRQDSPADYHGDYLETNLVESYALEPWNIITNPPFFLAEEIIRKALNDVLPGGFVTMLLRLNFFGSAKRYGVFFNGDLMPKYCFVHARRMPFGLNKHGKVGTDSIEYAHFVWQRGFHPAFTQVKVIAP